MINCNDKKKKEASLVEVEETAKKVRCWESKRMVKEATRSNLN